MATNNTQLGAESSHSLTDQESVHREVCTNQTQNRPSIRNRQRKLLGNFHFQTPVTPQSNETTSKSQRNLTPNKRQEQTLRAQRDHRKRTHDYISALEGEVMRLRSDKMRLQQAVNDWMQCSLTLMQSSQPFNAQSPFGPGVFLWVVRDTPANSVMDPSGQTPLNVWLMQQLMALSNPTVLPCLDICPEPVCGLLRNFCDNIAPSLSLTEASGSDYANRIIPLALSDEAVQNSFLAASASHARTTRATYRTTDILNYRSAAIKGLRKNSAEIAENLCGTGTAVFTLATILGLLIDDMINSSKEYPILIKLVDSWMRMYRCSSQKQEENLITFLLDQIQMIKTLVHPLYEFNELQNSAQKIQNMSDQPNMVQLKAPNFRTIFSDIQSAVTQACDIHNMFPAKSSSTESSESSADLEASLGRLQSTLTNIPRFAPGENQLIWVCATAVSRSSRADQDAFFTLRLAELLCRAGYSDIPQKLALARSQSLPGSESQFLQM